MALQSSQRLPELLFYTKKSYRILQTPIPAPILHVHITLQSREFSIQNPTLHAEDKELFEYYYYYIQRAKRPSVQKRNSTHRRQGDLLEIHPCVLQNIPGIQPQDLPKASSHYRHSSLSRHSRHSSLSSHYRHSSLSRHSRHPSLSSLPDIPDTPETFRTFQSFMTFQPFQAILQILQCSSISRESTPFQHSPIRMYILHILQFLQFDWFPQKPPPSTS